MSETISTWCPLVSLIGARQGKGRKEGRKEENTVPIRSKGYHLHRTSAAMLTVIALSHLFHFIFHAILLISLAVYKSLGADTCIVSPQTWEKNKDLFYLVIWVSYCRAALTPLRLCLYID